MKKTLFEQSFEDWAQATGGTRSEWSQATTAEWDRIRSSLIGAGHWHEGLSCAAAKCSKHATAH